MQGCSPDGRSAFTHSTGQPVSVAGDMSFVGSRSQSGSDAFSTLQDFASVGVTSAGGGDLPKVVSLELIVKSARGICGADKSGKSDPYVIIDLLRAVESDPDAAVRAPSAGRQRGASWFGRKRGDSQKSDSTPWVGSDPRAPATVKKPDAKTLRVPSSRSMLRCQKLPRTAWKEQTLEPDWNERFELPLDPAGAKCVLTLTMFDKDTIGAPTFLGYAEKYLSTEDLLGALARPCPEELTLGPRPGVSSDQVFFYRQKASIGTISIVYRASLGQPQARRRRPKDTRLPWEPGGFDELEVHVVAAQGLLPKSGAEPMVTLSLAGSNGTVITSGNTSRYKGGDPRGPEWRERVYLRCKPSAVAKGCELTFTITDETRRPPAFLGYAVQSLSAYQLALASLATMQHRPMQLRPRPDVHEDMAFFYKSKQNIGVLLIETRSQGPPAPAPLQAPSRADDDAVSLVPPAGESAWSGSPDDSPSRMDPRMEQSLQVAGVSPTAGPRRTSLTPGSGLFVDSRHPAGYAASEAQTPAQSDQVSRQASFAGRRRSSVSVPINLSIPPQDIALLDGSQLLARDGKLVRASKDSAADTTVERVDWDATAVEFRDKEGNALPVPFAHTRQLRDLADFAKVPHDIPACIEDSIREELSRIKSLSDEAAERAEALGAELQQCQQQKAAAEEAAREVKELRAELERSRERAEQAERRAQEDRDALVRERELADRAVERERELARAAAAQYSQSTYTAGHSLASPDAQDMFMRVPSLITSPTALNPQGAPPLPPQLQQPPPPAGQAQDQRQAAGEATGPPPAAADPELRAEITALRQLCETIAKDKDRRPRRSAGGATLLRRKGPPSSASSTPPRPLPRSKLPAGAAGWLTEDDEEVALTQWRLQLGVERAAAARRQQPVQQHVQPRRIQEAPNGTWFPPAAASRVPVTGSPPPVRRPPPPRRRALQGGACAAAAPLPPEPSARCAASPSPQITPPVQTDPTSPCPASECGSGAAGGPLRIEVSQFRRALGAAGSAGSARFSCSPGSDAGCGERGPSSASAACWIDALHGAVARSPPAAGWRQQSLSPPARPVSAPSGRRPHSPQPSGVNRLLQGQQQGCSSTAATLTRGAAEAVANAVSSARRSSSALGTPAPAALPTPPLQAAAPGLRVTTSPSETLSSSEAKDLGPAAAPAASLAPPDAAPVQRKQQPQQPHQLERAEEQQAGQLSKRPRLTPPPAVCPEGPCWDAPPQPSSSRLSPSRAPPPVQRVSPLRSQPLRKHEGGLFAQLDQALIRPSSPPSQGELDLIALI